MKVLREVLFEKVLPDTLTNKTNRRLPPLFDSGYLLNRKGSESGYRPRYSYFYVGVEFIYDIVTKSCFFLFYENSHTPFTRLSTPEVLGLNLSFYFLYRFPERIRRGGHN